MSAYDIAIWYANGIGYDTAIPAGEEGGKEYFHIFKKSDLGKKLGLPVYIKVDASGKYELVRDYDEVKRAMKRKLILTHQQ